MSFLTRRVGIALACLVVAASAAAVAPARSASARARATAPAAALDPTNPVCGGAGVVGAPTAGACGALSGGLLTAGKQLLTGNVGGAAQSAVGGAAGALASSASTAIGLAAIGTWVVGGAEGVLHDAADALGATTSPQLRSTWFSSTYWRMAAIAAVLTLPFLFAAAIQALIRSDLALLVRAAFGYLPLAMLATAIVAPVTTLLLAASDEMCSWISSAAGNQSAQFLTRAGAIVAGLSAIAGSPFLAFLIGLFMIGAAFALWIELLLREAAVYVIVLMLPLAFAALVWPARRIWAIRATEVLAALILSKFAIVAVLSLGGAAISAGAGHGGVAGLMAGAVLIMLAAFSPWALVRLVPMAEVASGAAGSLRSELRPARVSANEAMGLAMSADDAVGRVAAAMKRDADMTGPDPGETPPSAGRASASRDEHDHGAGPDPENDAPKDDTAPHGDSPPEPTTTPERPWSERSVLELGPGFGSTPVWPHQDAE